MLLQPSEKASLGDWLRTSSRWQAGLSFVCLCEQRNSSGLESLLRDWWVDDCTAGDISFTLVKETVSYSVSDTKHTHFFLPLNTTSNWHQQSCYVRRDVQGKAVFCSIIVTVIILHNNAVFLHFSIIITIIKNCLGCCSGRKFSLCYFPLAMTEELQEACIFLAGALGSMIISLLNACEKTNKSRWQISWVCAKELVSTATMISEADSCQSTHLRLAFVSSKTKGTISIHSWVRWLCSSQGYLFISSSFNQQWWKNYKMS